MVYYAIEVRSVDGSWSEIERVRASGYHGLVERFDAMCANSTGAILRLIKILAETD